MDKAVITGIGVISSIGFGVNNFWDGLINQKNGIRKITRFDTSIYPCQLASEVDFNSSLFFEDEETWMMSRSTQFVTAASMLAWKDAELDSKHDALRSGVVVGTALGSMDIFDLYFSVFNKQDYESINPLYIGLGNNNAGVGSIAKKLGLKGYNLTVSSGCNSGLVAVCAGYEAIIRDYADIVICGGVETPLFPSLFTVYNIAKTLTRNSDSVTASKPYDRSRDGFVVGEGCAMVVLESLKHAQKRDAKIYAEIAGFGMTNDATKLNMFDHHDITGSTQAFNIALSRSDIMPEDVDYISGHASSAKALDKKESAVIKNVFADNLREISISSIKGNIGHSFAATSGLQVAATSMAVFSDTVPPTLNFKEPDDGFENIDYTPNIPKKRPIQHAAINAYGLGGNNSVLILRKFLDRKA